MALDTKKKQATISTGGKEYLRNAVSLLSKAFEIDPVITYMLCTMTNEARIAYLPAYFNALLTAAAMNHAMFPEVEGWKACGVLMPPNCKVDNPWTLIPAGFIPMLWNIGIDGCKRMLGEFGPITEKAKAKGLQGQKEYYYVFFVATKEEERGNGYCGAMIRHWQELATRDQIPIWLEATTSYSMKIYESLGFETVDKMVLGRGKADETGQQCQGGDGVPIWAMIWRPKSIASKASVS